MPPTEKEERVTNLSSLEARSCARVRIPPAKLFGCAILPARCKAQTSQDSGHAERDRPAPLLTFGIERLSDMTLLYCDTGTSPPWVGQNVELGTTAQMCGTVVVG